MSKREVEKLNPGLWDVIEKVHQVWAYTSQSDAFFRVTKSEARRVGSNETLLWYTEEVEWPRGATVLIIY